MLAQINEDVTLLFICCHDHLMRLKYLLTEQLVHMVMEFFCSWIKSSGETVFDEYYNEAVCT